MKRHILLAIGAAASLLLAVPTQEAQAEVFADYGVARRVGARPYTPLTSRTVIPASDFRLPPSFVTDRDNGYTRVNLGFTFEYNKQLWTDIWINVNGFATFTNGNPPNIPAENSQALFFASASTPNNVIAPFWGDHYYRLGAPLEPGYLASEISYDRQGSNPGDRVFVVQWKNLNINDENIPSSVANFQLYIREASRDQIDMANYQGTIEFAYGTIGGNGPTVITQGASVGLKGSIGDYINALPRSVDINIARTSTQLSNEWPVTGGTDTVFQFTGIQRLRLSGWGDGDADLSHSQFGKHAGRPQNIFVTMNDVRLILRANATNIPLDSLRERQAYHADVNHNGRYFYSTRNRLNLADTTRYKRLVQARSFNENDSLPSDNSLPFIAGQPSFFYEANEYDASLIMLYMSGRIPTLPWLLDTIVPYGKVGVQNDYANSIVIPSVKGENGEYRIPVYVNGSVNGAFGTHFSINGEVTKVEAVQTGSNKVIADFNGSKVVIAATGNFDETGVIAYVTVKASAKNIEISDVRFNDVSKPSISVKATGINEAGEMGDALNQNSPNPFSVSTEISGTVPVEGVYTLAVYDLMGNKVKTLSSGLMSGSYNLSWDATNDAGSAVSTGTYVYRLEGEGVVVAKKLVVSR